MNQSACGGNLIISGLVPGMSYTVAALPGAGKGINSHSIFSEIQPSTMRLSCTQSDFEVMIISMYDADLFNKKKKGMR